LAPGALWGDAAAGGTLNMAMLKVIGHRAPRAIVEADHARQAFDGSCDSPISISVTSHAPPYRGRQIEICKVSPKGI